MTTTRPLSLLGALLSSLCIMGAVSAQQRAAGTTLQGTLHGLTGQQNGVDYQRWFLETADGPRLELKFDGSMQVTPGAQVEVTIRQQQGDKLVLQQPPKLIATPQHTRSLLQTTGSAPKGSVTMVVFIMDLSPCGTAIPATTPQSLRNFLSVSQPINLAGMYDFCSMGNVQLDVSNTLILNVPFSCNGVLNDGTHFATNTCDNVLQYQQFAEQYAERAGYNLGRYFHRVVILPTNFKTIMSNCAFDALGSQGPWVSRGVTNGWGAGYVWVGGAGWNSAVIWWHELGHNYGLMHARNEYGPGQWLNQNYGDYMSAMGGFGGTDNRCYDAPQLWTTGWSTPAASIDLSSLYAGSPAKLFAIPMQRRGPTGLKVTVTSSPVNTFVFSYRGLFQPYEKPLLNIGVTWAQTVAVHRAPSNVPTTDTALVGMLTSPTASFLDPGTLLSATLVSWDGNTATIAVCRRASANVPCYTPGAALPATPVPTRAPTPTPTPTRAPTPLPTRAPTPLPNWAPTPLPTRAPTPLPTWAPTPAPVQAPVPQSYTTLAISVVAPQARLNCNSLRYAFSQVLTNMAGAPPPNILPAGASTLICNNPYNNIQISTTSVTLSISFPSIGLANNAANYIRANMAQVVALGGLPCGSTITFNGSQFSCQAPVLWMRLSSLCCQGKL